jgi:hypothetical protein
MRKRIGLAAIAAVAIVVATLFGFGGVKLTDFITQLAVGLMLIIPAILYFMFKPEIKSLLGPRYHRKTVEQTQQQHDEGLKQYGSRSELPPFKEMLAKANVTVDMSGLDFRITLHQYMSNIRDLLYKDIRVTFLLLDPDSKQVDIQSKNFHADQDLKESIQRSIKLLCEKKEKLPPSKRGNLIIRLYDHESKHGLIITDEGYDNAWIKVEARPLGSDSNSRPSDAWYRRYDPSRYSQYIHEYNTLFHNSKEYRCPTS